MIRRYYSWVFLLTAGFYTLGWAVDKPPQPIAVSVNVLSELVVLAERDAPASALSLNQSRLSSEVTALIEAIPAQVGMQVEAGSLLVQLDSRDYELALKRSTAALQSVQARIKLAEFQHQRARELYTKKFASEDTLTQRATELTVLKAELAAAQAQLDSARRDLEKCRITAPFRAVVMERNAQQGELAVPGTPLVAVIDIEHLEVSAQIQTKDAVALESAASVTFVAPGQTYPVRLLRLSPAVDANTRTRAARFAFISDSAPSGSEGRIVWRSVQPLLPPELISRRNGRLGVFIAEHDQARFVALEQAQEGRPAPIGMPLDTRVILDGRFGLQDGQGITLKP